MRLPGGNGRLGNHPLLKAGVVIMTLALGFASVLVIVALLDGLREHAAATKPAAKEALEPLLRSDPPHVQPQDEAKAPPEPQPQPEPQREGLPTAEADWPMPTQDELKAASEPRHYNLPPGAIMGLNIPAIGIYNAPVFDSDGQWALTDGVRHVPETSLPWSDTPQRNVYIEGHRIGWPGTGSHLVFYHLNKLSSGDEVVLKNRDGEAYSYRVSEMLKVNPDDVWVMGEVVGRDMVTLQTCTPIPTYEKRLIVRAERV
jgi:sortase A